MTKLGDYDPATRKMLKEAGWPSWWQVAISAGIWMALFFFVWAIVLAVWVPKEALTDENRALACVAGGILSGLGWATSRAAKKRLQARALVNAATVNGGLKTVAA